jgi:hypothetical protein
LKADTAGGVSLRISIDKEGSLLRGSKASSQINRRRSFSYSTLLICNCDYSRHEFTVRGMARNLLALWGGFHVERQDRCSTWK